MNELKVIELKVYKEIAEVLMSFLENNYDHSETAMDLVKQSKDKLHAIKILNSEIY